MILNCDLKITWDAYIQRKKIPAGFRQENYLKTNISNDNIRSICF